MDLIQCAGHGKNITAELLIKNEWSYDLLIRPSISSLDLIWKEQKGDQWVDHYLSGGDNVNFDMVHNRDMILERGKTILIEVKAGSQLLPEWIERHNGVNLDCEVNLDWEDRFGHQAFLFANAKNSLIYTDTNMKDHDISRIKD
jgi:hypothetical protein